MPSTASRGQDRARPPGPVLSGTCSRSSASVRSSVRTAASLRSCPPPPRKYTLSLPATVLGWRSACLLPVRDPKMLLLRPHVGREDTGSIRRGGNDRLRSGKRGHFPAEIVRPAQVTREEGNAPVPALVDHKHRGIRVFVRKAGRDRAHGDACGGEKDESLRFRKDLSHEFPQGLLSPPGAKKSRTPAVRTGSSVKLAEKAAAAPVHALRPLRTQAIIQTVSLFICSSAVGTYGLAGMRPIRVLLALSGEEPRLAASSRSSEDMLARSVFPRMP